MGQRFRRYAASPCLGELSYGIAEEGIEPEALGGNDYGSQKRAQDHRNTAKDHITPASYVSRTFGVSSIRSREYSCINQTRSLPKQQQCARPRNHSNRCSLRGCFRAGKLPSKRDPVCTTLSPHVLPRELVPSGGPGRSNYWTPRSNKAVMFPALCHAQRGPWHGSFCFFSTSHSIISHRPYIVSDNSNRGSIWPTAFRCYRVSQPCAAGDRNARERPQLH